MICIADLLLVGTSWQSGCGPGWWFVCFIFLCLCLGRSCGKMAVMSVFGFSVLVVGLVAGNCIAVDVAVYSVYLCIVHVSD